MPHIRFFPVEFIPPWTKTVGATPVSIHPTGTGTFAPASAISIRLRTLAAGSSYVRIGTGDSQDASLLAEGDVFTIEPPAGAYVDVATIFAIADGAGNVLEITAILIPVQYAMR